jgi:CHAD domain-containing protein
VADERETCRIQLSGAPPGLAGFAADLASESGLTVPRAGLAAEALAVARGIGPAPRHIGAPAISPGLSVSAALCLVTGHLADVILYWAPAAQRGETPEPVHQMRVAVRRLRAALWLFRRVAAGPAFAAVGEGLKDLALRLGTARDWDVLLGGTGPAVQGAFPDDARIAALLAAAGRKRAAAYGDLRDYLQGDAWRLLSLRLALVPTLQTWRDLDDAAQAERLGAPVEDLAAPCLTRAQRRLREAGAEFSSLPPAALHDVRKQVKKLRYTTEFFAPLFGNKRVRRFLERLEDLQAALGTVNDGHVAAALMAQFGHGADRAFAAGVVQGYIAALSHNAAARAAKCWGKYADEEIFWH